MSAGLTLLCRAAVADLSLNRNKGRSRGICLGRLNRLTDSVQIIAVLYRKKLKPKGLHTLLHILCKGYISASLYGDPVRVIEHDKLAKPQCSCQ